MKIKGQGLEPPTSPLGGTAPTPGKGGEVDFSQSLKTARGARVDQDLKELLSSARLLGDRFLKSPDEEKLNRYKDGIRQFLERVKGELFSLRQEMGSAREGQQKVYQLVETVNGEVDSLTRETLQKDKALNLLASLDDIRGLVLDLFI
jgi:hypothetical protein